MTDRTVVSSPSDAARGGAPRELDARIRRLTTAAAVALAVATLGLATWSARGAHAQERPDAQAVASWVQSFYDQTRTMSARFVQRYVNRVYQRTDVSRGRVQFKKPGLMRFDYDEPNGKVVVSDGEQLTVYEPPDQEGGRGQYYREPISEAQLPAALSFLTGTGRLEEDFTFSLLDASRLGYEQGQILQLRSRRPTPHYSRILLFVDDDPQRRGVVHRVLIVDESNNRNRFDFIDQRLNRDIADSVFRFRPPRGARRIEP